MNLEKLERFLIKIEQQSTRKNRACDFKRYLITDLEIIEEFVKKAQTELSLLNVPDVVTSFPNDEEVKTHISTLPYYGGCTTEYNEGFEEGIKWLKEQITK